MAPPKTPKKRARSYDHEKLRVAVLAQFAAVRAAVEALTPEQLAAPTRLGDWTVKDLAAHFTMAVGMLPRCLAEPAPARTDLSLMDYPALSAPHAPAVAVGVKELAAGAPLSELYERTTAGLDTYLPAGLDGGRPVAHRFGVLSLTDVLVTRAVELAVHTDDLNDAVPGLDLPVERQLTAAATRFLADALAAKAPGGSTEVRIPPFAVVQCVEGPRHTRGTPPNVVETDPLTWLRLATGRTTWKAALDDALISASGERADLEALLPIMA
ncbi:maleylpyruvate isomerase family mycothiol-dependent enzyme [Streptomyces sp. SID8379]|uniref:maleylpyruvate isomerase family mycothiol-dependent enzyme n=1 Tax=unclassified Streptomyces TaxID=2593676 RepID=UPI00036BA8CD|nr:MULTISPECIES: maleylpyruvate isomerase family mycothiol-dependent enzyme [unclassified Streptomyces]MYW63819.1 maleylpyruvate isomerase family mycothiol-dependent enzyme [Streptomyces sp. SID8379]